MANYKNYIIMPKKQPQEHKAAIHIARDGCNVLLGGANAPPQIY